MEGGVDFGVGPVLVFEGGEEVDDERRPLDGIGDGDGDVDGGVVEEMVDLGEGDAG